MEKVNKGNWFQRLKNKWGLESNMQVVLILLVFTFAGSSVVFLRKIFFNLLGFDEQTNVWIKITAYLLFIFPSYQVLLLLYGFLFGQFYFFWQKEVKMLVAIRKRIIG